MATGGHRFDAVLINLPEQARQALKSLPKQLVKTTSWLALVAMELPAPAGVIVANWDRAAHVAVESLISQTHARQLLFRSEPWDRRPNAARGGYLVQLVDVERETREALVDERVVVWLQPYSPFDDLYSVNMAYREDEEELLAEVVGPGFDASDLKRGDLTPHEWLSLDKWSADLRVRDSWVVGGGQYRNSVSARLEKVGRQLGVEPNEPSTVLARLYELGGTILEEHLDVYQPIPKRLLAPIQRSVLLCALDLPKYGLPANAFVLSMSYVSAEAVPVYWDIVWPENKYRIPALRR
jgi:hypothetical protein